MLYLLCKFCCGAVAKPTPVIPLPPCAFTKKKNKNKNTKKVEKSMGLYIKREIDDTASMESRRMLNSTRHLLHSTSIDSRRGSEASMPPLVPSNVDPNNLVAARRLSSQNTPRSYLPPLSHSRGDSIVPQIASSYGEHVTKGTSSSVQRDRAFRGEGTLSGKGKSTRSMYSNGSVTSDELSGDGRGDALRKRTGTSRKKGARQSSSPPLGVLSEASSEA